MIIWKKVSGWWVPYDEETNEKLPVPSVTAVTDSLPDESLEKWRQEVGAETAERISKAAANRGSAFHKFLENYFIAYEKEKDIKKALYYTQTKTLEDLGDKIGEKEIKQGRNLFYQLFEFFKNQMPAKIICTETKIVNFELPYRGVLDMNYLTGDGQNFIVDFKTASKSIKPGSIKEKKYKLQLAAYCTAYENMFKTKVNASAFLVAVRDGQPQQIKISREEAVELFEEFKALYKNYIFSIWAKPEYLQRFRNYKIEGAIEMPGKLAEI